jgi:5-methylcytosine-specific restriction endonuclease McrA
MTSKQKHTRKARLISDYGSRCWWCKCYLPTEKLTLDHLKPKSLGGSNSLENLRLACFPCNNSRGNSLYPPQRYVHG